MKARWTIAILLSLGVFLRADDITSAFANLLYKNTKLGPPSQAGSSSANLEIASGGTNFSQGGLIFSHGGWGDDFNGLFDNLGPAGPFYGFPSFSDYVSLFDYTDGVNRIASLNGANAPLLFQPQDGCVAAGLGAELGCVSQIFNAVGDGAFYNPTSLASESLTNGSSLSSANGWAVTNDASFSSGTAVWTFSSGLASTLTQTSGNLAIAGIGLRAYRLAYTVSGVSGAPTASITGTFADVGSNNPATLDLVNGSYVRYFLSVNSPGNFVITSTLTTGQAFTLSDLSLKQITAGSGYYGGTLYEQALQTQAPSTVSGLPSCASTTVTQRRYVTDATFTAGTWTPGAAVVGGGNVGIGVQCIDDNGTFQWIID